MRYASVEDGTSGSRYRDAWGSTPGVPSAPPIVELRCRFCRSTSPPTLLTFTLWLVVSTARRIQAEARHVACRVPIVGLRLDAQSPPATVWCRRHVCPSSCRRRRAWIRKRRAAPTSACVLPSDRSTGEDHFLRLIVWSARKTRAACAPWSNGASHWSDRPADSAVATVNVTTVSPACTRRSLITFPRPRSVPGHNAAWPVYTSAFEGRHWRSTISAAPTCFVRP